MTRTRLIVLAVVVVLVALAVWFVVWLNTDSGLNNPDLDHPPKVPDYSGSPYPTRS